MGGPPRATGFFSFMGWTTFSFLLSGWATVFMLLHTGTTNSESSTGSKIFSESTADDGPRILKTKVEKIINMMKQGKATGPGQTT